MKRCVIIGGAEIHDYDRIRSRLSEDDYYIFCDSGLFHMDKLNITPNLIVGDFDSHENPCLPVETIVLPSEKDDTDTFYAIRKGLERGFDDFLLIGAVGGRMDHTLANISILLTLREKGKKASLIDDYSDMEFIGEKTVEIKDDCLYFSLLNLSGRSKGIYVENAKYPLNNAEIEYTYQYGVSNEVLPGKTARVRVSEGNLLLIRVYADIAGRL